MLNDKIVFTKNQVDFIERYKDEINNITDKYGLEKTIRHIIKDAGGINDYEYSTIRNDVLKYDGIEVIVLKLILAMNAKKPKEFPISDVEVEITQDYHQRGNPSYDAYSMKWYYLETKISGSGVQESFTADPEDRGNLVELKQKLINELKSWGRFDDSIIAKGVYQCLLDLLELGARIIFY